jgi:hypothetical protein
MGRVTSLFCLAFPARNQFQGLWDARIYASHLGNPFARRHNFYRKVATIRRQFGNEKGGGRIGLVPRTQRSTSRSGALQSRGPGYLRLEEPGSRFCEAALRKSYALHRARDTQQKGAREGRL